MSSLLQKTTKLKITDDSGFIAIVNADKYNSFVNEDWELKQLMNHFISEMNKETLLIWATGSEDEWAVAFLDTPSIDKAFREFNKTIEVTNGQLFLTNYEDLTMAAQFRESKIPAAHHAGLNIKLDNGRYDLSVRQMFDPTNYDYDSEGKVHFEIIVQPATNKQKQTIDKIYWRTE